jgi:pantetheine-phosphate adenylyltransferase
MARQRFSMALLRLKWIWTDLLASVCHMKRAVCPGSFDPVTFGHLDIIERASAQFDDVVVAVLVNRTKASMFTVPERMEMILKTTAHLPNVRVDSWSGLLVDYCKSNEIQSIVKGLRAVTDFDYELQMAQVNLQGSGVETMFMATAPTHSFLSSSLVKELAYYGGDVSTMVPEIVNSALKSRVQESGK